MENNLIQSKIFSKVNVKFLALAIVVFSLAVFSFPQDAHAATFTAVQSGAWNDPTTWDGTVPGSADDKVIPDGIIINTFGPIDNEGTIDNSGDIRNFGTITNSGTIDNAGVINNNVGGTIDNAGGSIGNSGVINNNAGTIFNSSIIRNTGTINNFKLIDNFGTINIDNTGTINNLDFGARLNNHNSGTITNSGTINNAKATIDNTGSIGNFGIIYNNNLIRNQSIGSIDNAGTLNNDCGGIIAGIISGNQPINVCDTTPPTITVPDNITAEATGPDGVTVEFEVTAIDDVDGDRTPTCTPASGSTFVLGDTTVMCTATDFNGNSAEASFTVTVQDTIAPTVAAPADATFEATGPLTPLDETDFGTATASDAVGVTSITNDSPGNFPLGATQITWSAEDAAGNIRTSQQTITVQDTTAPVITILGDNPATHEAATPYVDAGATAFDSVDGDLTSNLIVEVNVVENTVGSYIVSYTVTDSSDNTASAQRTVNVIDTTPPVVTVPFDIIAEATSPAGATVTYGSSATDTIDGEVVPICNPASGSTYALGDTTVTCIATDSVGNEGSASFMVSVQDTTPSTLTILGNNPATILQNSVYADAGATASDIVDGDLTGSIIVDNPVDTSNPNTYTVTYTVSDSSGNTAQATRTVVVKATTEATQDLIDEVNSLELPGNTANSLTSNLDSAISNLSDNNPNNDSAACGKLGSFVNKVEAQSGKKIDSDDADALIASAEQIRTALGC